ncbi:50S ribosomal protein L35, partial [uncultured Selenomonas sp.]
NKAYKRHILEKKTPKRKRNLRKAALADNSDYKRIRKMLPYA